MNVCNIYNKKVAESSETATFIDLNQCCVRTQRHFFALLCAFLLLVLERDQRDVEHQSAVCGYRSVRRAVLIAKSIRDVNAPAVAHMHLLQRRDEAVNSAGHSHFDRHHGVKVVLPVPRGIELIAQWEVV